MKCKGCDSASVDELFAPDPNSGFLDLVERMRKVKAGKFRCKFHNLPIFQRDAERTSFQCRSCERPSGATDFTQVHLKNAMWHLNALVAEARDAFADISWLLAELSNKDSLDSLQVADVFCMLESKYNQVKDVLASWNFVKVTEATAQAKPPKYTQDPDLLNTNATESTATPLVQQRSSGLEELTSQHRLNTQDPTVSQSQQSVDTGYELHRKSGASGSPDSPAWEYDSLEKSTISKLADNAEDEYTQTSMNYKLTAHNKRLFEKWNKKYYGDIKNLKYKPLCFRQTRTIHHVPKKFFQVNFVRNAKYPQDLSVLLYDDTELRLQSDDGPLSLELKNLFCNQTGLKIGWSDEYDAQCWADPHLTALACSNKGNQVLLGMADGTLQKRNAKYELLKSQSLESGAPVKGVTFNDNDSIVLVAQHRKIISLRADTLDQVREFTTREDICGLDTWHGQLQAGQRSCFEIIKQSNPAFRVLFQQDCSVERFKIGRTGDQVVLLAGPNCVDVIHHSHALWKVVHRLEFAHTVVNMDFLGEYLVVLLDQPTDRKVITFKMAYL